MKALPLLSFILGAEAEPEAYNHDGDSAVSVPIGVVKVPLTGAGYLSIQSTSPDVLIAMSAAFLTAAGRLRGHIAAKDSAPESPEFGADALDEAGTEPAEGGQPDLPALAAPPSNLHEVVEATIYCWADESLPCTCRDGNDCPRRAPEGCGVRREEGAL